MYVCEIMQEIVQIEAKSNFINFWKTTLVARQKASHKIYIGSMLTPTKLTSTKYPSY